MTQDERIHQALEALKSDNADQRAAAIEELGELKYAPAVGQIIDALMQSNEDSGTAFIAAKALGRIGEGEAVPALLEHLRGDDPWVRVACAGALIKIGSPSVDGLIEALKDEDKAVRRAAAKALGKIGEDDPRAMRGLSTALLDVDKGVRRFAAEALGRMNAEDMVGELTEVLKDKNPRVRIAAFKALANIATPEAQSALRKWVRDS